MNIEEDFLYNFFKDNTQKTYNVSGGYQAITAEYDIESMINSNIETPIEIQPIEIDINLSPFIEQININGGNNVEQIPYKCNFKEKIQLVINSIII